MEDDYFKTTIWIDLQGNLKYSISNKELQVFFFRFFKLNLFFLLFSILKYPFLL